MLFYRAALSLSPQTLSYLSGVLRRHRKEINSPWRRLNPGQQALLVLVHLRKGETLTEIAAGFGVGVATAWRYIREAVTLLAARSPRLDQVLRTAKRAGYPYLVLDGTLIPIDRVAADRPYYSGKHKKHGMNIQVLATRMAHRCGPPDRCPARCTTSKPPGSGASCTVWKPSTWSPLPTRAMSAPVSTCASPTRGATSPPAEAANIAHAKLRGPGLSAYDSRPESSACR